MDLQWRTTRWGGHATTTGQPTRFDIFCARWIVFIAAALLSSTAHGGLVTRSDIELLALSATNRPDDNGLNALASQMCGVPVDLLGAGPHATSRPAVVQSWLPLFPAEGEATVHITGVGISRLTGQPISGPCEGTITFKYRFRWVEHGDTIVGYHTNVES